MQQKGALAGLQGGTIPCCPRWWPRGARRPLCLEAGPRPPEPPGKLPPGVSTLITWTSLPRAPDPTTVVTPL